ncbi:hypothetical protein BD413DRAFT_663300 [Trametes elegans]|nr:hypothetical protein BD413DRAFT_663300 [Trametes elegans]
MLHLPADDRYTALPRPSRSRTRRSRSIEEDSVERRGNAPRTELLNELADTSFPPASAHSHSTWSRPGDLEVLEKNHYLLTPIRTRLFPKASPGVLRNLLATPSLRAITPDQSISAEDSSPLGSPLQRLLPANGLNMPSNPFLSTKGLVDVAAALPSVTHPGRASGFLPSPPPSTELPAIASFPLPNAEPEFLPVSGRMSRHDAQRPEPIAAARRSSPGHRSPFLELIPSGLRAAPCSPLLTTLAVVDESSPPRAPCARPGPARRASDPRVHAHAHTGLASGVVRDFRRVLDELQGLGPEHSAVADDIVPPSDDRAPGLAQPVCTATLHPCAGISGRPLDTPPLADCESFAPTGLNRAAYKRYGFLGSTASERLLGTSGDAVKTEDTSHDDGPVIHSSSFDDLENEFVDLLSEQAGAEEAHAEQLRKMADRLEQVARCKRHLARIIAERRP